MVPFAVTQPVVFDSVAVRINRAAGIAAVGRTANEIDIQTPSSYQERARWAITTSSTSIGTVFSMDTAL
jgi:hypothetical protein